DRRVGENLTGSPVAQPGCLRYLMAMRAGSARVASRLRFTIAGREIMSSRQICALVGMIALAACQDVRDAATRVADSDSVVIAIGGSAAIALTTTLMSRVRAEIERAGPAAAI